MRASPPIVLMTDFGMKDVYAASMKGVILSIFPGARVIDLTHEIEPQNLRQASFTLEAAYPYFPKNSIFVSVVDPGVGSQRQILAARTSRWIFLAPDNGLLTRVLDKEKCLELRVVTNKKFFLEKVSSTFHGRDCFAPTAAWLAKDAGLFSKLGPRVKNFTKINFPMPRRKTGKIVGEIIYFDHFGNAFTNLTKDFLKKDSQGLKRRVRVGRKNIGSIQRSYFEAKKNHPVAVLSSTDFLEIAVNHGSARNQLRLKEGTRVEAF